MTPVELVRGEPTDAACLTLVRDGRTWRVTVAGDPTGEAHPLLLRLADKLAEVVAETPGEG